MKGVYSLMKKDSTVSESIGKKNVVEMLQHIYSYNNSDRTLYTTKQTVKPCDSPLGNEWRTAKPTPHPLTLNR